jgi:MFS family permease
VVVIALSAGLGVGVGILSTVASAVVGKLAPGDREGAAFGLVQSANGLGSAVGPLLGGGMAAFLGLRSTFWLEGSVFLLMAFVVYATKRL